MNWIALRPGLFTVSYDQKSLRCDECNTGSILSGTLSATNASGEDGAVLAAARVSPVKADGALGVLKFTAISDGKPSFRLDVYKRQHQTPAADVAHPGDEGEKAVLHDASSCEWFSVFSTFYHVARGL